MKKVSNATSWTLTLLTVLGFYGVMAITYFLTA